MDQQPAPIKKERSEAQIASLEKARTKARELREQRNVIREKNGIGDETDETPTEPPTDQAETQSNPESTSETEDDVSEPVVEKPVKKAKPVKKEQLIKPKKTAPRPKKPNKEIVQNIVEEDDHMQV